MNWKQKLIVWVVCVSVYLLYLFISGGGILIEHKDSLAVKGAVARAQLTPNASVYLKERAKHFTIMVPFLIYYERYTYPFKLRYYGSTRSGRVRVTSEKGASRAGSIQELVVVTDVRYFRKPPQGETVKEEEVVTVGSWADIVIPGPGEWVVESKGYVKYGDGRRTELTFPTMTIRQTLHGRIRILNALNYWVGGMMR